MQSVVNGGGDEFSLDGDPHGDGGAELRDVKDRLSVEAMVAIVAEVGEGTF
ncbi:hypothetical protein TIFTF001_042466 [Ficus carica]|uniref:Uncharacterized protein n=1 Tax=Ficus carica TaxID=3494 RepID=A0AA87ZZU0_FICCA|nr:hypothetical protein TIFTF001_042466 [Ficus carica]